MSRSVGIDARRRHSIRIGLLTQYGATHLSGYSLSSPGMAPGFGLASCTKGRSFQIEFVSRGHGFGIAKDTDGNVYRFLF
jgi:hypothetical protein